MTVLHTSSRFRPINILKSRPVPSAVEWRSTKLGVQQLTCINGISASVGPQRRYRPEIQSSAETFSLY